MKRVLFLLLFMSQMGWGQNIAQCKKRYNTYLNFRTKLNPVVQFETDRLYILNAGKKELAVYEDEVTILARLLEATTPKQQLQFFAFKGLRHLTEPQLDSLGKLFPAKPTPPVKDKDKPLNGYKIAIDPGHFATHLKEAAVEQKFLYFKEPRPDYPVDSVKLFESELTFNTAFILQKKLEEKGATVMLTRQQANFCAFDCSYSHWLQHHKKRVLDSLKANGSMAPARHNQLVKSNDYKLFWDFFRDYDLGQRATKINRFSPHVTVIIHYNVDEKNAPWKKSSPNNFTMAFIGGAFTASDLGKNENRADFLRLLLSDQLNKSEFLAAETVANFGKNLNIPIAKASSADYLQNNCNATSQPGVFCRNLVLCRKINSPLVYGEALYQDNELECRQLMKKDVKLYGINTNSRIEAAVNSYYEAVLKFLEKY